MDCKWFGLLIGPIALGLLNTVFNVPHFLVLYKTIFDIIYAFVGVSSQIKVLNSFTQFDVHYVKKALKKLVLIMSHKQATFLKLFCFQFINIRANLLLTECNWL